MLDPVTKGYLTICPESAARTLLRLEKPDLEAIVEAMPSSLAAVVLESMAPASASRCLRNLRADIITDILSHMRIPASVEILRHLHREQVKTLLDNLPRTLSVRLRLRLRFSEAAIGASVDVASVTFSPGQHVGDALRSYRRNGKDSGHTIYVLDESRHLLGEVQLNNLLTARDRSRVERIMGRITTVLNARATIQSVASHAAWLNHDSLPVVDRNNVFQGVLRRSRVIEKEQQLISQLSDKTDLETTRSALADVFWIAIGAFFISDAGAAARNKAEE